MWSLILHGGARTITPEDHERNREGISVALQVGMTALTQGHCAVDVVEAVVRVLEDHPAFNAGRACVLNSDGDIELDAAIMDGTTLEIGAVAALRDVRNPVAVARLLLREKTVMLAGGGAAKYARERNMELLPDDVCKPGQASSDDHDTVGCIARDSKGHIAVATSTGGLSGKLPGRVGDAPLPGCGFYAENAIGGVAFSGEGEVVMRLMLAARAMHDLSTNNPETAMRTAVGRVAALMAEVGGIAMDAHGNLGLAHNSDHFAFGTVVEGRRAQVCLHRSEWVPTHE
jgi:beta-aspartyl-peptidase (threonine type)